MNRNTDHDVDDGAIDAVIPHFDRPVDVELLSLLLGDDEPSAPAGVPIASTTLSAPKAADVVPSKHASTHKRRPYSKDVCIAYMSTEERREYNNERQRERRAAIKKREADLNAVTFNQESAREALADAALMILASNAAGAEAIQSYLAAVYRTQPGAPLTLTGWIRSGAMKPKLLKYTQPAKT